MSRRWTSIGLLLTVCACQQLPEEDAYRQGRRALQKGDLRRAATQVAEGLRRARQSRDAEWLARYGVLEAEILVSERRNHEALALLQDLGVPSGSSPELRARALMTRAYARCLLTGAADNAQGIDADFVAAERMAEKEPGDGLKGDLLLRWGTCAVAQGDFLSAEIRLLAALRVARRLRLAPLEAHATGSLGRLSLKLEHYDQAVTWLERSLDMATSLRMDNIALKTLGNLGWCYLRLGDLERALTSLKRAESLAERLGYSGDLRMILTNIGNVHFRQGNYESARHTWERALAIGRDLGDKRAIMETLGMVAAVALEQKHLDEAERCVQDALSLAREIRDFADEEELRLVQGRILMARGDTGRAEATYRQVIASPHSMDAIRWETHAAFAGLHIANHQFGDAEREFRRAFDVMEGMRAGLSRAEHKISFFSSLARYYDDYVDFLIAQGKPAAALTVADRSRALYLREILRDPSRVGVSTNAGLQDVARAQRASLLLYWTAPDRSFVWCVTPRRIDVRELPGEKVIEERVRSYQRLLLRSRDPLAEGNEDGLWLYRTLVAPVAAHLQGGRVIVVPDGPLHELSFETLIASSPRPHYWIEDVTVALAPALGLLDTTADATASERHPGRSILLIGDPLSAGADFPRLPSAAAEMQRIAAQFPEAKRVVYEAAEAEPGVYKRALPERFGFIHFSAHAVPNTEQPLESAVILSPKGDAFKLYARDIIATPLRADLVTLSACYGAGSRHYAGEGFVGLAWAFLGSGARNVVAGLWNVEETSTVELMEALYRGLDRGLAPPEALREAKLGLLHSQSAYRKPYYWAPFVTYTRRWEASTARPPD